MRESIRRDIHHVVYYQQRGFKRQDIADQLGWELSDVKLRLGQAKNAWINGYLPYAPLQDELPIQDIREETIDQEMGRKDRLVEGRDARFVAPREFIHRGAAELLGDLLRPSSALEAQVIKAQKETSQMLRQHGKLHTLDEEEAIMHITDLHHCRYVAGRIDEATTEMAFDAYLREAREIITRRWQFASIRKLKILYGGDNMHGDANYPHQSTETTGNTSYQIAKTSYLFINKINVLRTLFPDIEVEWVAGNHGRKSRDKNLINDNYELELGLIVQAYFANVPGVRVQMPEQDDYKVIFESLGRPQALIHGDTLKAGNPAAILQHIRKLEDIWPPFESIYLGHWHRTMALPMLPRLGSNITRWLYIGGTASIDDAHIETFAIRPITSWWLNFTNRVRDVSINPIDLYR